MIGPNTTTSLAAVLGWWLTSMVGDWAVIVLLIVTIACVVIDSRRANSPR